MSTASNSKNTHSRLHTRVKGDNSSSSSTSSSGNPFRAPLEENGLINSRSHTSSSVHKTLHSFRESTDSYADMSIDYDANPFHSSSEVVIPASQPAEGSVVWNGFMTQLPQPLNDLKVESESSLKRPYVLTTSYHERTPERVSSLSAKLSNSGGYASTSYTREPPSKFRRSLRLNPMEDVSDCIALSDDALKDAIASMSRSMPVPTHQTRAVAGTSERRVSDRKGKVQDSSSKVQKKAPAAPHSRKPISRKGKERETQESSLSVFSGREQAMDVDTEPSGTVLDLDPYQNQVQDEHPHGTIQLQPSLRDISSLPQSVPLSPAGPPHHHSFRRSVPPSRALEHQPASGNTQPTLDAGSSSNHPRASLNIQDIIRDALSSEAANTQHPPRSKPKFITSVQTPSTSSRSSSSNSSFSRSRSANSSFASNASSGNGSMKRTEFGLRESISISDTQISEVDSVYGSVLPKPKPVQPKAAEPPREPSPFEVPGLQHTSRTPVNPKDGREPKVEVQAQEKRPKAVSTAAASVEAIRPTQAKAPPLGMMRRHNVSGLSRSKTLPQVQQKFRAPFKTGNDAGPSARRTKAIMEGLAGSKGSSRKELDKPGEKVVKERASSTTDADGPDIHEGAADSSTYFDDVSMDSEMGRELDDIERKLTQSQD
uniref:Uncharacterized protein n=1 Tax=Moniliophthora roreri TaxID=221103 RepID=A0A0W0G5T8_MONRR